MKFLLELVACCGSCSGASMVKEEARLLAGSVPPPSPRVCRSNKGRKRGRSGPNGGASGVEWRPSLSSICEDNVLNERTKTKDEHPPQKVEVAVVRSPPPPPPPSSSSSSSSSERNLKRRITSAPRPRSYPSGEDVRRPSIHAVMPAFSPAPFMF